MSREEKLAWKNKIITATTEHLQTVVEHLKAAMDDAQTSANEYGQPKDRYDSYRAQLLRKRDMFGQQLKKTYEQQDILKKVEPEKLLDKVMFGAVVFTENQKIFISIGLGTLDVDGEKYFVISPVVPFYKAIQNLSEGDAFEFREKKEKISVVF